MLKSNPICYLTRREKEKKKYRYNIYYTKEWKREIKDVREVLKKEVFY